MDDDTTRISTEKAASGAAETTGAPASAPAAAPAPAPEAVGAPVPDPPGDRSEIPAFGPTYAPLYDTAGTTPPPFGVSGTTGSTYGAIPGPWPHDPAGAVGAGSATATATKRGHFRRSRDDRMLAGVCGGLGRALDVDAALIRVGLVLLTVFGVGAGAIAYLAAWILVPEED